MEEKSSTNQSEDESLELLFGASRQEMDQVFEDAPVDAKQIVDYLKDPSYLSNGSYRYVIFAGEPGVGKTTLAKAIAYKAGWRLVLYAPGDLIKKERNATSERFSKLLNKVVGEDIPTVVVVDELNQFLENYESKKHDTDATSKTFWSDLDRQKNNRKFFFIGTMNRVYKLPPQMKSRILGRCIEILRPQDGQTRKRIFFNHLLCPGVKLDSEAEKYIDENMKKLDGYTGRDFSEFALVTQLKAALEKKNGVILVTKKHLEQAAERILATKKYIKYGQEEETDEERQERHHKENIDLQDLHFVQQQLMSLHILLNHSMEGSTGSQCTYSWHTMTDINVKDYIAHFTPEQIKIHQKIENYRQIAEQRIREKLKKEEEENKKEKKDDSCCII